MTTKEKGEDKKSEKKKAPKKEKVPKLSFEEYQKLVKDSEELGQTKDKLLRTVAEFENTKRRLEKQKDEFVQYANKQLLTEFLPILDNLTRAIESAKANHSAESLLQGVEMTNKLLLDALKNHGLAKIEAFGKPFDPNIHEAIGVVETDEEEEDTVVEEISTGYMFKEVLLKPSMVKVSKKKA